MSAQRQQAYLTAFSKSLRAMIDQGVDPAMAEQLAHRDAAHIVDRADGQREAVEMVIVDGIQSGAAMQRGRTQGAGAAATNKASKMAQNWIIEQWQTRKHESRFGRLNARRGTESPPSRAEFAKYMAAPGGPLERQFPGLRITDRTAKTIAETWLKDLG